MKALFLFLFLFLLCLCGCARLTSTTYDKDTGKRTTSATVLTFFDSGSELTKFANRAQLVSSNEWAPGTTIGGLNQSATSTNLVPLVEAIVSGAVQGAVKGAK